MSKLDIIILLVVFICGLFTKGLYDYINNLTKKDYYIENLASVKKIDSLKIIISQRDNKIYIMDTLIKSIKERQVKTDILIIKNYSKLKNDKDKYEKLSTSDRIKYVDSLLKVAGVRK